MTTARELIEDALGDIGVLDPQEPMTGDQAAQGLRTLNRVVDDWNARQLSVYAVKEVQASFAGATATIGTGLTINTDKPLRLEPGCYYVKSGLSYPLTVWTQQDYNSIILKSNAGDYPTGIYFDRLIPGTVYVWPVPSVAVDYRLMVFSKLSQFADLDTAYSFPDGYANAFFYTLCERLPAAYNLPVNPDSKALAVSARQAIKTNNTQVPTLQTANDTSRRWNIFSNQYQ